MSEYGEIAFGIAKFIGVLVVLGLIIFAFVRGVFMSFKSTNLDEFGDLFADGQRIRLETLYDSKWRELGACDKCHDSGQMHVGLAPPRFKGHVFTVKRVDVNTFQLVNDQGIYIRDTSQLVTTDVASIGIGAKLGTDRLDYAHDDHYKTRGTKSSTLPQTHLQVIKRNDNGYFDLKFANTGASLGVCAFGYQCSPGVLDHERFEDGLTLIAERNAPLLTEWRVTVAPPLTDPKKESEEDTALKDKSNVDTEEKEDEPEKQTEAGSKEDAPEKDTDQSKDAKDESDKDETNKK